MVNPIKHFTLVIFYSQCDCRDVVYERKLFIRLATAVVVQGMCCCCADAGVVVQEMLLLLIKGFSFLALLCQMD